MPSTVAEDKLGLTPAAQNHNHLFYATGGSCFVIFPRTASLLERMTSSGFSSMTLSRRSRASAPNGCELEEFQIPGATVENGVLTWGT